MITFGLAGSGRAPDDRHQPSRRVSGRSRAREHRAAPTGSFVTWLVVVDTAPTGIDKQLSSSWSCSVVANPTMLPDGSRRPRGRRADGAGGRLDGSRPCSRDAGLPVLARASGPRPSRAWKRLAATRRRLAPGLARVRARAAMPDTEILPPRTCRSTRPRSKPPGSATPPGRIRQGRHVVQTVLGRRADAARSRRSSTRPTTRGRPAAADARRPGRACANSLIPVTHLLARAGLRARDDGRRLAGRSPPRRSSSTAQRPGPARAEGRSGSSRRWPRSRTRRPRSPAGSCSRRPTRWTPDVDDDDDVIGALRDTPARAAGDARRAVRDGLERAVARRARRAAARSRDARRRRRSIRPSTTRPRTSSGVSRGRRRRRPVGRRRAQALLSRCRPRSRPSARRPRSTKIDDDIQAFTQRHRRRASASR